MKILTSNIKINITEETKTAMRSRDKRRLAALRLIASEIKKVEVDERIDLDDNRVIGILNKMTKQRKDSLSQYVSAGRDDLAEQEEFEITLITEFTPKPLDDGEIEKLIDTCIAYTAAESMGDMGKVMKELKDRSRGRADMSVAGNIVKAKLS